MRRAPTILRSTYWSDFGGTSKESMFAIVFLKLSNQPSLIYKDPEKQNSNFSILEKMKNYAFLPKKKCKEEFQIFFAISLILGMLWAVQKMNLNNAAVWSGKLQFSNVLSLKLDLKLSCYLCPYWSIKTSGFHLKMN